LDLDSLTLAELAKCFEDRHGVSTTPQTMQYRLRTQGMTRQEAIDTPKHSRGNLRESDVCYCYMHVQVDVENAPVAVKYVGLGSGGRVFDYTNRCASNHSNWLIKWFRTCTAEHLHFGVDIDKLRDLGWIDTSSKSMHIIVSKPSEDAAIIERELIKQYQDAGHELFNIYRMKSLK